jgi:hypothetical protein
LGHPYFRQNFLLDPQNNSQKNWQNRDHPISFAFRPPILILPKPVFLIISSHDPFSKSRHNQAISEIKKEKKSDLISSHLYFFFFFFLSFCCPGPYAALCQAIWKNKDFRAEYQALPESDKQNLRNKKQFQFEQESSPLHAAADQGHLEALTYLLSVSTRPGAKRKSSKKQGEIASENCSFPSLILKWIFFFFLGFFSSFAE